MGNRGNEVNQNSSNDILIETVIAIEIEKSFYAGLQHM
jgi:hypothetical protein